MARDAARHDARHHADEVLRALHAVTSDAHARAAVARALRVAGVRRGEQLDAEALLMLCTALAAEGGPVEQIAVEFARRALDQEPGTSRGRPDRP